MKISLTIIAIFISYLIFGENDVTCAARGGGGRGGGSRGGSRSSGSRSSYRSGSSNYRSSGVIKSRTIVTSSRYSRWSVRVGIRSNTRFRTSPWASQQHAILRGHIIMSSHYNSRFHYYDRSSYDDISVCYNEEPLYGRNITASPWFICPWDDLNERYCCGNEVEERCCRYFDRSGPKAGLIVGLILLLILFIIIYFCYKKSHSVEKTTTIVYAAESKDESVEGATLLVYPPIVNNLQYPVDTSFNCNTVLYQPCPGAVGINPPYPVYPPSGDIQTAYIPTGDSNSPYPIYQPAEGTYLPYEVNNFSNLPYPVNPQPMQQNVPLAPESGFGPNQPPPSYEDAVNIKT